MAIARMNAMVYHSCYRYSYLARLDTSKTADCSIWSDRKVILSTVQIVLERKGEQREKREAFISYSYKFTVPSLEKNSLGHQRETNEKWTNTLHTIADTIW